MPSNSRSAGVAVVTCFALACGAVLGITAIINHGRATSQHKIATPSPFGQGSRAITGPEPSLILPETGTLPVTAPAPAAMAPMLAEFPAAGTTIVPPAAKNVDQAGDQPGNPPKHVDLGAPAPPVPAMSSRNADKPTNPDQPMDLGDPADAGNPEGTSILGAAGPPAAPDPRTIPGTSHLDPPVKPAGSGTGSLRQGNSVASTIPGTHRPGELSQPKLPARIGTKGALGGSGNPGTSGLPLSTPRPGSSSGSATNPLRPRASSR